MLTTTTNRIAYAGNGSTTVFAYNFRILVDTDLLVYDVTTATGSATLKTLTTHYTVSGAGDASGGNVTMVTAPASGHTLLIIREEPRTQAVDYVAHDNFPAETHESALDKLTMIVQELDTDLARCFQLTNTDTTGGTVTVAPDANKALIFDASGNLTTSDDDYDDQLANVTTQATNAANSATAAATSATSAASSATNAATSASAAASSATAAASSASDASTSASAASTSASAASTSASAAATSATNAATSATAAANSATTAATQATNAATSASSAATSATNAATSATAASTSASAAATSATAAASSASAAATSATNAATSATNAAASEAGAAAVLANAVQRTASTGSAILPSGTTAQRDGTPAGGYLRFNTTSSEFEGYNGSAWSSVGGATVSNDTSTSSNIYPLSASATSGTASTVYTSNAKLLYKPSTGELQASELVASNGLVVNSATVSASYTIASGYNAMSVGPVTVSGGVSVTITGSQRWIVL